LILTVGRGIHRYMKKSTVFIAFSGGVDSSIAAALLKHRGYDVVSVFMRGWSDNSFFKDKTMCPWVEDQQDARRAAAVLDIPFYTWDVEQEYKERVVDYMVAAYRSGITPNPDVMCNKEIKFGIFFRRALTLGADFIATGHYARVKQHSASAYKLLAGIDTNKDQSYFLWTLSQKHLRRVLFPIGEYTKPEVRELARTFGLPNAERKESQGVCFVGELSVFDFLKSMIPQNPGPVLTASGKQVGEHEGAAYYTVGQRHGIGTGGGGTAYYVAEKDITANVLYVAESAKDPHLYKNSLLVSNIHWVSGAAPMFPLQCLARIRYRQPLQVCTMEASDGARAHVRFDAPQRAVTPGQSVVFYDDDIVLGGGVIVDK